MTKPTFSVDFPVWLRSDHAGFRTFVALICTLYFIVQVFGNLPDSHLKRSMKPSRKVIEELGLYERGWGMFAASNTATSVARTEVIYADGTIQYHQYIHYKAGYAISPWNEVIQDLMYDDNGDKEAKYLRGFLRYICDHSDLPGNDVRSVSFQTQVIQIPSDKDTAPRGVPFVTRRTHFCDIPPQP
jgi:hypothetical protein